MDKRTFFIHSIEWDKDNSNLPSRIIISVTTENVPNLMDIDIATLAQRNDIDNYIISYLTERFKATPIGFDLDETI